MRAGMFVTFLTVLGVLAAIVGAGIGATNAMGAIEGWVWGNPAQAAEMTGPGVTAGLLGSRGALPPGIPAQGFKVVHAPPPEEPAVPVRGDGTKRARDVVLPDVRAVDRAMDGYVLTMGAGASPARLQVDSMTASTVTVVADVPQGGVDYAVVSYDGLSAKATTATVHMVVGEEVGAVTRARRAREEAEASEAARSAASTMARIAGEAAKSRLAAAATPSPKGVPPRGDVVLSGVVRVRWLANGFLVSRPDGAAMVNRPVTREYAGNVALSADVPAGEPDYVTFAYDGASSVPRGAVVHVHSRDEVEGMPRTGG